MPAVMVLQGDGQGWLELSDESIHDLQNYLGPVCTSPHRCYYLILSWCIAHVALVAHVM
jgi:hypothetical protein